MNSVAIAALILGVLLVWMADRTLTKAHKTYVEATKIYRDGITAETVATEKYKQAAAILQQNNFVHQEVARRTKELKSVHREITDRVNGDNWEIPEDWLPED